MLTAQAAALNELRAESDRMRMLFAEMLAFDDAMIASLARNGHTPHLAMFPFTERMRAFVPHVAHSGVREFVPA